MDYTREYSIRFRLRELLVERDPRNARKTAYMIAKDVEAMTGVPLSVAKRIIENTSKGVDNVTLMRLSLGLRCSINDLFEIDAADEGTYEK